jgi:hypothetical protein
LSTWRAADPLTLSKDVPTQKTVDPKAQVTPSAAVRKEAAALTEDSIGSFEDWDFDADAVKYYGAARVQALAKELDDIEARMDDLETILSGGVKNRAVKQASEQELTYLRGQHIYQSAQFEIITEVMKMDESKVTDEKILKIAQKHIQGLDNNVDVLDGYGLRKSRLYQEVRSLPADEDGRALPSEQLRNHLDRTTELGRKMLSEVEAHVQQHPHYQANLRDALDARSIYSVLSNFGNVPYYDPTQQEDRNWLKVYSWAYDMIQRYPGWKIGGVYDRAKLPDPKDMEKANPGEAHAIAKEWMSNIRFAARRSAAGIRHEQLIGYLNEIRPMGHQHGVTMKFEDGLIDLAHGSDGVTKPVDTPEDIEKYENLMWGGARVYPTAWLRILSEHGYRRGQADRAYHLDGWTPETRFIALTLDRDNMTYQGGFDNYESETAAHELGHGVESHIPGVAAIEWALLNKRTREDGTGKAETPHSIIGHADEYAYDDDFVNKYAGKTYLQTPTGIKSMETTRAHRYNYELFTTGIQDLFAIASEDDRQYTKPGDDEVSATILAMLATYHSTDEEVEWMKQRTKKVKTATRKNK